MKTKLSLFTMLVLAFSVAVAGTTIKDGQAMRGNSMSEMGTYTITVSETPLVHDSEVLETYDLMYEYASNPIKIAVLNEKKCKTFIVRSDEFEVQYTCQNGSFGVKKLEKRFREIPEEEMDLKLNRVGYYAQRVICNGKKTNDDYLGLIACFLPDLLNSDYQAGF